MRKIALPRIKVNPKTFAPCGAAVCIGVVAWRGIPALIALSAIIPPLIFSQRSRVEAFLVTFAYYAAANWPLIPGTLGYFGPSGTVFHALPFWAVPSLLLPLPWTVCWTAAASNALWRLPLAYMLSIVPPFGIIGWASPLTTAGILFPGWAWIGLALVIAISALVLYLPQETALTAAFLVLAANLPYPGDPIPPKSWEGVFTSFERISDANNPAPEFQVAKCVQRRAVASNRQVIVFPESMVPNWTDATELMWKRTLDQARVSRKTLLIGVGLPISGTSRRCNAVLVVRNGVARPFLQRIPVPGIMWNPLWGAESTLLRLFDSGILEIDGKRAALLVCYEQLLVWPILESALQHPTLIVGLANDNWARGTPIPAAQQAAVTAWARLFHLSKVLAINL
jgi:hypothetical protein